MNVLRRFIAGMGIILLVFVVQTPILEAQSSAIASSTAPTSAQTNNNLSQLPWYFNDLHINRIWSQYATGSPDVVVAVIDDGVDGDHPELTGTIWTKDPERLTIMPKYRNNFSLDARGWNFIKNIATSTPHIGRHGTFIAGIIAGHGPKTTGIARGVRIMPIIVCTNTGDCSIEAIVRAIYFAVNNGAQIINISLDTKPAKGYAAEFDNAIAYAWKKGAIIVAAAGNSPGPDRRGMNLDVDTNLLSPVCNETVIGVGASTLKHEIAYWSNYGNRCVDVYAPGESIISAAVPDANATSTDASETSSGSSYSAAIVTSIVALLKSKYPSMPNTEIQARLLRSGPIFDPLKAFQTVKKKPKPVVPAPAAKPVIPYATTSATKAKTNAIKTSCAFFGFFRWPCDTVPR